MPAASSWPRSQSISITMAAAPRVVPQVRVDTFQHRARRARLLGHENLAGQRRRLRCAQSVAEAIDTHTSAPPARSRSTRRRRIRSHGAGITMAPISICGPRGSRPSGHSCATPQCRGRPANNIEQLRHAVDRAKARTRVPPVEKPSRRHLATSSMPGPLSSPISPTPRMSPRSSGCAINSPPPPCLTRLVQISIATRAARPASSSLTLAERPSSRPPAALARFRSVR